jgi:hypothetical protein
MQIICVSVSFYNNVEKNQIETINNIQDKPNKISGPKADVKQELLSRFSKKEGFKVTCEISCVLEGEDILDSGEMNH